jgi:hypothetical protein
MPYTPKPGDTLTINGVNFTHTPHPAAKRMARASAGAKATVFHLVSSSGAPHGLKVFLPGYRTPRTALNADNLLHYADLPGMQVCARTVLTPADHYQRLTAKLPKQVPQEIQSALHKNRNAQPVYHHGSLLQQFPDLEYAVLMPWMDGYDWREFIGNKTPLSHDDAYGIAASTAGILAELERSSVAHGDISSGNVKVDLDKKPAEIYLVDVDDMYAPGLPKPEQPSFSTGGYNHQSFQAGQWDHLMDRFSTAVILGEILGWSEESVRLQGGDLSYFRGEEMQKKCERYLLLSETIRKVYGKTIAEAFASAWFSKKLEGCPSLTEWEKILKDGSGEGGADAFEEVVKNLVSQAARLAEENKRDEAINLLNQVYSVPTSLAEKPFHAMLLERANQRKKDQDFEGALADYQLLLQSNLPEAFREDVEGLILCCTSHSGKTSAM